MATLIPQSLTIASAMPTTPSWNTMPNRTDRMTRQTTVEKMDETMVKVTSPAARRPLERLKATGQKKGVEEAVDGAEEDDERNRLGAQVVERRAGPGSGLRKEVLFQLSRPDIGQPQQLLHIIIGAFHVPGPPYTGR